MMYLAKTVGYAVHALCCIEKEQGRAVLVRNIAGQTSITKPYLAKIINQLVCQGLVASKRGREGGVVLARPANQISLLEIVEAFEGGNWSRACFFGLESCPSKRACPAHAMWAEMRGQIETSLRQTTLAEVARITQPDAAPCQRPARSAARSQTQPKALIPPAGSPHLLRGIAIPGWPAQPLTPAPRRVPA